MFPWCHSRASESHHTPAYAVGDIVYSGDCHGVVVAVDAEKATLGVKLCRRGHTDKRLPNGDCRACANIRSTEHRAKPGKKAQYRARDKARHENDPRHRMLVHARYRAKKSGVAFSICVSDVAPVPTYCPLLGIPLFMSVGAGSIGPNSPTLDRIRNGDGYVPGNVMVISHLANSSKRELNSDQLMMLATNLRKFERGFPWE